MVAGGTLKRGASRLSVLGFVIDAGFAAGRNTCQPFGGTQRSRPTSNKKPDANVRLGNLRKFGSRDGGYLTISVPFINAMWPGKEQRKGYSPASVTLNVVSALFLGPSTGTNATTLSFIAGAM